MPPICNHKKDFISHPNIVKATLGDVTARCATPAESMLSIVWAEWPSPKDKIAG